MPDAGDGCTEYVWCLYCTKRTAVFPSEEMAAAEWNEVTRHTSPDSEGHLSSTITGNPCALAAKDGEPVFILLGRDPDAEAAVRYWAQLREARVGVSEKTVSAKGRADEMAAYRSTKT